MNDALLSMKSATRQIIAPYVLFATVWILTVDRLLTLLPDSARSSGWQSLSAVGFVLVSAVLLHSLLRRYWHQVQTVQSLSSQARDEYQLLFDKNPNPMWVFDGETLAFLAVNEAAIAHYGYSKDEFMEMTLRDIRPPEDSPALLTAFENTHNTTHYQDYWRHQTKDGRLIQVLINSNRLVFAGRSACLAAITDVTAQSQAETAARQSEARMRQVLENMPVLLDTFDENGNILVWNEECERVTGYSVEEIVGNPKAMEMLYPDSTYRQQMIEAWTERGDYYRNWEWDLVSKDGTVKTVAWSNVSGLFPIPGWASWGIGVDVSDRKQAYDALQRREHYFKSLTENSSDLVVLLDAQGTFLYCTPSSERVLGYTLVDVVGRNATEFVLPDDVPIVLQTLQDAVQAPQVSMPLVKYRVWHQDGSVRVFEAVTTSLLNDPIVQGVVVNCRDVSDRHKTEEELRQSELRFQRMAANVPGVIYRYLQRADGSDAITYINSGCRGLYELEPEAIEQDAQLIWALFHPDDIASLHTSIARSTATLEPWQWEGRIITPSGRLKWIRGLARPERQANGDTLWDGLAVDISDRKQQEAEYQQMAEAWQQSEERFRSLSLCAPIGIYMADSEGNGTWANPRLGAIAGCDENELLGPGWAQLIHPEDQAQAIGRWQAYHTSIRPHSQRYYPFTHEYRLQRPDGNVRWVRSTSAPLFDDAGNLLGRVGAVEDITNRKLAEEAIQQLNATLEEQNRNLEALVHQRTEELRTFINALPDAVFVIENPTMRILFSNQTHCLINGFSPDTVQGKTIFECFPADKVAEFVEQNRFVFESGTVLHLQQTYAALNGILHLDTYKIPLKRPDGEVYALIGTSRNVTELVEARQALMARTVQLEATNRELDSFSYSVSHDLRAPLRHISGFVKALRDELEQPKQDKTHTSPLTPTVSRYLQIIADSSKKMGLLIDGLLMLSRMGRRQMQPRPVDLTGLVQTAIELINDNPEIGATEFLIGDLPVVIGDATLLQQVFTNLIENALKFSRDRHPAQIEIGCLPDGVMFVRDQGVGFDMRYADQLFGAFQRLHSEREFAGTGIGLAIVQRIIHRHNGKIWAESKVGEGATFYFTLHSEMGEQQSATGN
jgi:PAS domain S-box-containing protein